MTSRPDDAEAPEVEAPPAEASDPDESASSDVADIADSEAPVVPDERLLEAHDLALAALAEITPLSTVGAAAGYTAERDGVVSLRFATTLAGYPGWFWTVSLARVGDADPTVLEVELLPRDGALLAPDWVPWAVRLADYQAQQAAAAEAAALEDVENSDDDLDDLDDIDDLDASDFDRDGSPLLHSGDVDGVDIDSLDDEDVDEDLDDDDTEADEDEDLDEDDDADDDSDEDALEVGFDDEDVDEEFDSNDDVEVSDAPEGDTEDRAQS